MPKSLGSKRGMFSVLANPRQTFAHVQGTVEHESALLRKIRRVTGLEDPSRWLLKVAVERGAFHYPPPMGPDLPPDSGDLSDEEIGIGLCLGSLPYNPMLIRAAGQLLSAPSIHARRLAHLARQERVEPILHAMAHLCERFDSGLEPWRELRSTLRPRARISPDGVPHWTRLVSHTGFTREGGPRTEWLRRRE